MTELVGRVTGVANDFLGATLHVPSVVSPDPKLKKALPHVLALSTPSHITGVFVVVLLINVSCWPHCYLPGPSVKVQGPRDAAGHLKEGAGGRGDFRQA